MRKKYTITLILNIIAILICTYLYFGYISYQEKQGEEKRITLVTEELSINYITGNKVEGKEENAKFNFSITNHSSEIKYYYVKLENIEGDLETANYVLTSDNKEFKTIESDFSLTNVVSHFEIAPGATHRYEMEVKNPKKEEYSFEINTDIEVMDNSFYNTILSKNEILYDKEFQMEETNEPKLIQKKEQFGDIYYFQGNVENNYVSFAGLLWRIVRINEDNTVKLILNNTTENFIKMKETSNEQELNFLNSLIEEHLENWYEMHLKDFDDFIISTNYCYDNGIVTEEENRIDYLASTRLEKEFLPTNACGGMKLSQKIALLTADEVMYAGINSKENKENFLYIPSLQEAWWTMTPNKKINNETEFYVVNQDGSLKKDAKETANLFVRPAITLIKKAKVTGEGTKENPYVVTNSK